MLDQKIKEMVQNCCSDSSSETTGGEIIEWICDEWELTNEQRDEIMENVAEYIEYAQSEMNSR